MKKQIKILLFFLFVSTIGLGQNCYKLIADMSGIDNQLAAECNKAVANGTYINDHFAKVDWNKIYQNI